MRRISEIWNYLRGRTRSVLAYIFDMESMRSKRDWLISKVTANGLSSSRVRRNPDGSENWRASQRVEFRVRTNAESKISEIIQAATK